MAAKARRSTTRRQAEAEQACPLMTQATSEYKGFERHCWHQGFLDHRHQGPVRRPARLQERQGAALTQLGVEPQGGSTSCLLPSRVLSARSRWPLRCVVRSPVRSWRPAPIRPSTSVSVSSCTKASATQRRRSPSPALASSSASGRVPSVIGFSRSGVRPRNSTPARRSGDPLRLHPHGLQIPTITAAARAVSALLDARKLL